ncbi:type III polyketide synthase, partial [Rhizobium ruizarguesonis]
MPHSVKLVSITTAGPPHVIDQLDAARASHAAFSSRFGDFEQLAKVFDSSGIRTRYGVRPIEWYLETAGWPE